MILAQIIIIDSYFHNRPSHLSTGIDGLSFSITNYNGTATSKCPKGYFSTVIFHCDPRASWSEVKDHNVTKYMTADPDLMECEVCYFI